MQLSSSSTCKFVAVVPIIVKPRGAHSLERHQRAKERSNQRDQATKDQNSTGNDLRNRGNDERAANPHGPLCKCDGGQMSRALQETNKDVFGRKLISCVPNQTRLERF